MIDCFLFEGSKVLLRIALAIFHLFVKTLTHDSAMVAALPSRGLQETLYQFCQNIPVSKEYFFKVENNKISHGSNKFQVNYYINTYYVL